MKPERDNVVSVIKVRQSTEEAVKEAIRRVGGMESVVKKGDEVFLKPNFVAPRDSSQGVTTDFEVIRVVAEEVRRFGGIPVLFETPAIEFDKDCVFDYLGVYDFARKNKIQLVDGCCELIKVQVPRGKVFRSLRIPKVLHRAKIINLPKLKTHVVAKMTCGMKNLMGLLPDPEKRSVHIRGVQAAIADIGKVFQPILTVVDATTCQEGDGPTYGDKIDLGLIISGRNIVSVDKVCSEIIGLPWEKVGYISLSDSLRNTESIKVVGESVADVRLRFTVPQKNALFHLLARLIYMVDVVFSKFFSQPFIQFLYSTGYVGTNVEIIRQRCDGCGDCVRVCPVEGVLNIERGKVDYKNCIRCLDCFIACKQKAITVKGFSRPKK